MSIIPRLFIKRPEYEENKMFDVPLLMQSPKFLTVYRWCCTYSHNYPCASCFLWGTAQNAQGSIQFRYECVYNCTSTLGVNCSVLVYQVVMVETQ